MYTPPPQRTQINPSDAFLQKLDKEIDLPAMGSAVARVVHLASSDDQAVRDLAYYILSDVALTQKILRLANTVHYRSASGGNVTTVSRAIFLLGFETVKTTALTMLLVERLSNREHSHAVGAELKKAMCASMIGREMARCSKRPGAEEAAIAALFVNIGQVMVASHDYPRYAEILDLARRVPMSEDQAAVKVLGYGYSALSQSILRSWNIPESIMHAIVPLPPAVPRPARAMSEWLRQIASFSVEATPLVAFNADAASEQMEDILVARFGTALHFDRDTLQAVMQTVRNEVATLSRIMDLDVPENTSQASEPEPVPHSQDIPQQFLMQPQELLADPEERQCHASGKPMRSKELLLEGVQHLMELAATGEPKAGNVMLLVLETLFNSMGFRFAAICLRDAQANQFRARMTLGEAAQQRKAGFVLAPDAKTRKDLFGLAMESGSDLMIADASDPKIREMLPAWHRTLLPDARSFMILPIVVRQTPLGFFYGDRALPAPEGVARDEAALIQMLKTQLVASFDN